MQTFEIRKREATIERKTSYNIPLSISFITYFTSGNESIEDIFHKSKVPGFSYSSSLGIIRIEPSLMVQLFNKIIDPIVESIRTILSKIDDISILFLVGGFAESNILKQQIKLSFEPEIKVVIPYSPHLSVLYGACLYGLDPGVIKSRRTMLAYGIAVLVKFEPNIHPADKRIASKEEQWCCDVFNRFVSVNQSVGLFESVKQRFTPVMMDQNICKLNIYSTDNPNALFTTDPGVRKCATLYLNLEPIPQPSNINPAIKELIKREVEIEMFFGETEIKVKFSKQIHKAIIYFLQVRAIDLQTGHSVKSNIDFLNTSV